ncbi:MAG: hypothetical protein WCI55_05430 [Armatimonadota bacterium]
MPIIIFRGLLGENEDHSVVGSDPVFRQLGVESKIFKFQLDPDEVFEAAVLGHSDLVLDQGPLTVASMGFNPPERSVQFHLSLLSVNGDQIRSQVPPPSIEEFKDIQAQLIRLNTKSLTVLIGEGLDHALVCEKRLDIRTTSPSIACQNGKQKSLPEGDSENEFRRFIDDSENLLTEQEFNQRRIDHGISPINLCWPWGQGQRPQVPNRALELGYPWKVLARSIALRGLAKLSGFRPYRMPLFEFLDYSKLAGEIQADPRSLVIIDVPPVPEGEEEREAFQDRITSLGVKLIDPLLQWRRESKGDLVFVATNREKDGLIAYVTKENERDHFPFDERSFTERRVPMLGFKNLLENHE